MSWCSNVSAAISQASTGEQGPVIKASTRLANAFAAVIIAVVVKSRKFIIFTIATIDDKINFKLRIFKAYLIN